MDAKEMRGEMERLKRTMPDDLAVTLTLTVRLHQNGSLSVEGPVQDKAFCRKLLDEAWHAINRQSARGPLIVPGEDVDSRPKEAYACRN